MAILFSPGVSGGVDGVGVAGVDGVDGVEGVDGVDGVEGVDGFTEKQCYHHKPYTSRRY